MSYTLDQESYLMPSPAGAYYCVMASVDNAARRLLRRFLSQESVALVTNELMQAWSAPEPELGLQTLHHLQGLGWLQTMPTAVEVDKGPLEDLLPRLLEQLSCEANALLTDSQGFCLTSVGFAHESAEEISALGADLVTLHSRHQGLLNNNLKMPASNWGLLDAAGHSQLGFWPLHIGQELFSLVIAGPPCLHRQVFMYLVWILHNRYATSSNAA
ncbi:MAG: hypothetical protein GY806_16860 [Gammaproteobacteria bacterium]|nr:hypothetical protein [Gammaproteobacteria bacterium]